MSYKSRVDKALDIIFSETPIEYVIDTYEAKGFVEVVGSAGGDILTYRVFDNGTLGQR